MIFKQLIECFLGGFTCVIQGFFSFLPIKDALDSLNEQILAAIFGVPTIIISILLAIISVMKKAFKIVKKR